MPRLCHLLSYSSLLPIPSCLLLLLPDFGRGRHYLACYALFSKVLERRCSLLHMLLAEDVGLPIPVIVDVLLHLVPGLDKLFPDRTTYVETSRAILVVALDTAVLAFALLLAVRAEEARSLGRERAFDHLQARAHLEPHLRRPVNASYVHPADVGVHDGALQVSTHDAGCVTGIAMARLPLLLPQEQAPFAEPVTLREAINQIVAVTALMHGHVALVTEDHIILIFFIIVIVNARVTVDFRLIIVLWHEYQVLHLLSIQL